MIIYCLLFHTNCLPCIAIFIPPLFALLSSAPSACFFHFQFCKFHLPILFAILIQWNCIPILNDCGKLNGAFVWSIGGQTSTQHIISVSILFGARIRHVFNIRKQGNVCKHRTNLQLFENYFMSETANIKLVVSSSSPPPPPVFASNQFQNCECGKMKISHASKYFRNYYGN